MTADAEGNDLEKVFIPVTGFLAVQLTGEPTWVDPTEGSATPLVLPEGYVKVGLFKQDGGPPGELLAAVVGDDQDRGGRHGAHGR